MFHISENKIPWLAAGVVVFGLVLAFTSVLGDAIIVDEIPHIGAGYSYVTRQDMRLNPEHPPLAKDLAGLGMLFLDLKQSAFETAFWQKDVNGQWEFGRRLVFNSGNDPEKIAIAAKTPMFLFYIFASLIIFVWGRRLYGNFAGLISVIIFTLSPTVIAHSRFVTTDIPALFGILSATYFFLRWLEDRTQNKLFLASGFFGIALLLKFSTFLLVPYLGLLACIWGFIHGGSWKDRFIQAIKYGFRSVGVFAIGFIFVVWPVYYYHTYNYPPERQYNDTRQNLGSFGKRWLAEPVVWASDKPVLRAAAQYTHGLLMVIQRAAGGNTVYFLGDVERYGWRHYFPLVYFLKEPLAWWGLAVIALAGWAIQVKSIRPRFGQLGNWLRGHFHEFAFVLWLTVYWYTSITSTLNIGVRHLLPTYPFAILLVSGQITKFLQWLKLVRPEKWKAAAITVTLLLTWYALENARVYPYYLTYFNQTAGGPSGGYRYVVDSNLDWGQDLRRFDVWVKENNIRKIEFDYFGWSDPYYYLKDRYIWLSSDKYLDAQDFAARNQSDGWLAVSATFLQGSIGPIDQPNPVNYLWLKSFEPTTVIGNSIFIYRIK